MGKILGLDPWDLSDVRVGNAEVTFKVNDNSRKLNATDIAVDLCKKNFLLYFSIFFRKKKNNKSLYPK